MAQSNIVDCMVFLCEEDSLDNIKKGLGVHPYTKLPIVGECITVPSEGIFYKVKVMKVCDTSFSSNHQAELSVVETDDV